MKLVFLFVLMCGLFHPAGCLRAAEEQAAKADADGDIDTGHKTYTGQPIYGTEGNYYWYNSSGKRITWKLPLNAVETGYVEKSATKPKKERKEKKEVVKRETMPEEKEKQELNAEIKKAMGEQRIVKGMTLAQANAALSVSFKQESDDELIGAKYTAVANYKINNRVGRGPGAGAHLGDATGTEYVIWVKDGVIISWCKEPYFSSGGTARVIGGRP